MLTPQEKTHTATLSTNPYLAPKTLQEALEKWRNHLRRLFDTYNTPLIVHWLALLQPIPPLQSSEEIFDRMLELPLSQDNHENRKVFIEDELSFNLYSHKIMAIHTNTPDSFTEKRFCDGLIYAYQQLAYEWQKLLLQAQREEADKKKSEEKKTAVRKFSLPSLLPSFMNWRNTTPQATKTTEEKKPVVRRSSLPSALSSSQPVKNSEQKNSVGRRQSLPSLSSTATNEKKIAEPFEQKIKPKEPPTQRRQSLPAVWWGEGNSEGKLPLFTTFTPSPPIPIQPTQPKPTTPTTLIPVHVHVPVHVSLSFLPATLPAAVPISQPANRSHLSTKRQRYIDMTETLKNLVKKCKELNWKNSVQYYCCLFPKAGKRTQLLNQENSKSLVPDTVANILKLAKKQLGLQPDGEYSTSPGKNIDYDEFHNEMIKLQMELKEKSTPTTSRTKATAERYTELSNIITESINNNYQQRLAQLNELAEFCQNTTWTVNYRVAVTWLPQLPGKKSKGLHVQDIIPDTVKDILQLAAKHSELKKKNDFSSGDTQLTNLELEMEMQTLEKNLHFKILDNGRDPATTEAYIKMYDYLVNGIPLFDSSQSEDESDNQQDVRSNQP